MRADRACLQHIHDAVCDIETFLAGITREAFLGDKEKQYAVLRALEIIGEAARNVSDDLKKLHPEVPWRSMSGMRDKLIHQYFGVKLDLVWETVQQHIPKLKRQIADILETPSGSGN